MVSRHEFDPPVERLSFADRAPEPVAPVQETTDRYGVGEFLSELGGRLRPGRCHGLMTASFGKVGDGFSWVFHIRKWLSHVTLGGTNQSFYQQTHI